MTVVPLENVESDSLAVFLAHGIGQKECSGRPGEDFSFFVQDFSFGIAEALGQLTLPSSRGHSSALYRPKIVDLDFDRCAATAIWEFVEDRSTERAIEQGEEHAAMDSTRATHMFR